MKSPEFANLKWTPTIKSDKQRGRFVIVLFFDEISTWVKTYQVL
jgi:hypothetical protein